MLDRLIFTSRAFVTWAYLEEGVEVCFPAVRASQPFLCRDEHFLKSCFHRHPVAHALQSLTVSATVQR